MSNKKTPTIRILDEINMRLENFPNKLMQMLKNKYKFYEKGYRQSMMYKNGIWDGKTSLVDKEGNTFLYYLEGMVSLLSDYMDIDDISIVFEHETPDWVNNLPNIDKYYFQNTSKNLVLFDYQTKAVNKVIEHKKGILDHCTNAGKTYTTAVIADIVNRYGGMPTIVLVPNANLAESTKKDFEALGMEAGTIHASVTKKNREKALESMNLITTNKSLANLTLKQHYGAVLLDECDMFGPQAMNNLSTEPLSKAPVRVSLSGSVPDRRRDILKRERLCGITGNDVIHVKKLHETMGVTSSYIDIHEVIFEHKDLQLPFRRMDSSEDWAIEHEYLLTNNIRIDALVEFMQTFLVDKRNTLILCEPALGFELATQLGYDFIDQDISVERRQSYFDRFADNDYYRLVGSYGCISRGISIDNIFNLIAIDLKRSDSQILQSIGRGARRDTEGINRINMYDLHSNTPFSTNQARERSKLYVEEKHSFQKNWKRVVFDEGGIKE